MTTIKQLCAFYNATYCPHRRTFLTVDRRVVSEEQVDSFERQKEALHRQFPELKEGIRPHMFPDRIWAFLNMHPLVPLRNKISSKTPAE